MLLRIPNTGLVVALTSLILLLFVNAVVTHRNTAGLERDAQQMEHTHKIVSAIYDVRTAVKDAEIQQLRYLLSGEEGALHQGVASIESALGRLSLLLGDDPIERDRFSVLRERIDERIATIESTIALRKQGAFDIAKDKELSDRGLQAMLSIRAHIESMVRAEDEILARKGAIAAQNYRKALLTGQFAAAAIIVLFLGTVLMIRRNVAARTRVARELAEQHDLLRTTLASIVEGIIVTDTEGRVTFMNPIA